VLARSLFLWNKYFVLGTARVANTPMITMTITISIMVNPRSLWNFTTTRFSFFRNKTQKGWK
jgi:hypothetical protein